MEMMEEPHQRNRGCFVTRQEQREQFVPKRAVRKRFPGLFIFRLGEAMKQCSIRGAPSLSKLDPLIYSRVEQFHRILKARVGPCGNGVGRQQGISNSRVDMGCRDCDRVAKLTVTLYTDPEECATENPERQCRKELPEIEWGTWK
jgi:hypothetical protein